MRTSTLYGWNLAAAALALGTGMWLGCMPDLQVADVSHPGSGGTGGDTSSSSTGTGGTGGAGGSAPVPGSLQWVKTFGGAGEQWIQGVTVDGSGNIYIAGVMQGTVNFGMTQLESAGNMDIFVAKFTSTGELDWARSFGGTGDDFLYPVGVDIDGNIILSGSFQQTVTFGTYVLTSMGGADIYVAKLDADGNTLWAKQYGDADDQGASSGAIAVGPDDRFYVVSSYMGTIDFGKGSHTSNGGSDVVVAKLYADGEAAWSESFGGPGNDYSNSAAVHENGGLVVSGSFDSTMQAGGGMPLVSIGWKDIFLLRLLPQGLVEEKVSWGSAYNDYSWGNSAHAITGLFQDTLDFGDGTGPKSPIGTDDAFLAKLQPGNGVAWVQTFGNPGTMAWLWGIAEDADGNFVSTGLADGEGGSQLTKSDILVVKYDGLGNQLWKRQWGGSQVNYGTSAAIAPDGSIYVVGSFKDVDFGSGPVTSQGASDVFLMKLSP